MISSKDISVIVQGAINKDFTSTVLKSIRKHLPQSEIILSTWKGSNVSGLDYDILVENEDPGAELLHSNPKQFHNLNRQIVSTKGGLEKSSRKYTLKTRSDILLSKTSFLEYFESFPERCSELKILEKRIVVCNYYVRKPEFMPFHVGDWVFFGLTTDIKEVWDIPLAPEPETTKWFHSQPLTQNHKNTKGFFHFFRHRYCAEQYIWMEFLKKHISIKFDHMFDISFENSRLTNLSIVNNTIVLPPEQYGIKFLKYSLHKEDQTMLTFLDWQILYKKHCDPNYKIIKKLRINFYSETLRCYEKIKNHSHKLIKSFYHILFKPFSIIFYFVKLLFSIRKNFHKILKYEIEDTRLERSNNEKQNEYFGLIVKNIPQEITKVNLVHCASGEALQLAKIYNCLAQQQKDKYALVVTSKKTKEIFELFVNKEIFLAPLEETKFINDTYFYKNKEINILFSDSFWFCLWAQKIHFIEAISKFLDLETSRIKLPKVQIKNQVLEKIKNKCKTINLNLEKFIFISPEANSIDNLPKEFWEKIIKHFSDLGFDIYQNTTSENSRFPRAKSCHLNYEEVIGIASQAKAIIGLRSGLLEFICGLKVPIHVIYNIKNMNDKNPYLVNVIENYSLFGYPDTKKDFLFEYKYEHNLEDQVFEQILNNQKNFENF